MKTSDGYRFGLQFKILSDAHRQVGEFLESLGNKKSEAVVTAMIEYIRSHPEVLNKDNPVKVIAAYGYSEETLNARIEAMVRKVSGANPVLSIDTEPGSTSENDQARALDALLNGLDRFE